MVKSGVINVGAAGTFIVSKSIKPEKLELEFRRRLPFETEVTICSDSEVLRLARTKAYDGEPSGPEFVRLISVLSKRPRLASALPLSLPFGEEWLVKIVAIEGRFALGMYRRAMRTIATLGQLEKHLGCSITTRNWNTFSTLFEMLRKSLQSKS
ncbi:MAG: hypothetical protein C5B50_07500 [Verrucomicrobia bacterium]|nr:MAG: hypothetical protein C5B50_07500 [Verrucomicrobiota bacterium]